VTPNTAIQVTVFWVLALRASSWKRPPYTQIIRSSRGFKTKLLLFSKQVKERSLQPISTSAFLVHEEFYRRSQDFKKGENEIQFLSPLMLKRRQIIFSWS
jgi:hypothetical protein